MCGRGRRRRPGAAAPSARTQPYLPRLTGGLPRLTATPTRSYVRCSLGGPSPTVPGGCPGPWPLSGDEFSVPGVDGIGGVVGIVPVIFSVFLGGSHLREPPLAGVVRGGHPPPGGRMPQPIGAGFGSLRWCPAADRPFGESLWGQLDGSGGPCGASRGLRGRVMPCVRPLTPSLCHNRSSGLPSSGAGAPTLRGLCVAADRAVARGLRGSDVLGTWLILPVVICLSQRLSHACLSISKSIR
jgi:hypothetical protein